MSSGGRRKKRSELIKENFEAEVEDFLWTGTGISGQSQGPRGSEVEDFLWTGRKSVIVSSIELNSFSL